MTVRGPTPGQLNPGRGLLHPRGTRRAVGSSLHHAGTTDLLGGSGGHQLEMPHQPAEVTLGARTGPVPPINQERRNNESCVCNHYCKRTAPQRQAGTTLPGWHPPCRIGDANWDVSPSPWVSWSATTSGEHHAQDHQPKRFWHKLQPGQQQDGVSAPLGGSARDAQLPAATGHTGTTQGHLAHTSSMTPPKIEWLGGHHAANPAVGNAPPGL